MAFAEWALAAPQERSAQAMALQLSASPAMFMQRQALSRIHQSPAAAAQLKQFEGLFGQRLAGAPVQAKFFVEGSASGDELTKAAFLDQLRAAIQVAADQELAAIQQTSDDCPYLAKWFAHYQDKDASYIQRAIARYAPESASAGSVDAYIQALVARVRQGLKEHVSTGSTEAVPQELAEEAHAPQDFVHIANEGTAQLSKLCSGGEGKAPAAPAARAAPVVDHAQIYANATTMNADYPNVRSFVDVDGKAKIIKLCSSEERSYFATMSGTEGFPVFYGGSGLYAVIQFIGDYPKPAKTADGGDVSSHLQQAANLCREMGKQGISHNDLDNNMLFYGGQLVVVDFGASRSVDAGTALGANRSFIERFLDKDALANFNRLK